MRVFIESCRHLLYIVSDNLKNCSSVREEDFGFIPVVNINLLKNQNIVNELKNWENTLRGQRNSVKDEKEKKIITALINRFSLKRKLIQTLESAVSIILFYKS